MSDWANYSYRNCKNEYVLPYCFYTRANSKNYI